MALGCLRIPEEEYWDTTLRSLMNRIEGFFEMENRREQGEWERVRWQSVLILNMFAKKGRSIKPKDLVTFPWEQEKRIPPPPARKLTPEEIREKFAKYDEKMRKAWQRTG